MLPEVFKPFVEGSPVTVMAGAAITRLLSAAQLDELFDKSRKDQYVGELLFSTVFHLMAAVVTGTRKSIHHAYQTAEEKVGVSVVAVYDKLQNIETCTSQALVRHLAKEAAPLIDQMGGALPPLVEGYTARILDGNCIAASEHRIKELRTTAAGALPGKSLAVLDPQRRLILDVFPCEDGHAQERALLDQVVPTIDEGNLWIADRNFCVFSFLAAIRERRACFLIRRHGNTTCQPAGPHEELGAVEGGVVSEQAVRVVGPGDKELKLRLIELRLEKATRDGDKVVHLLSNLPGNVSGRQIAQLYRSRWKIETAFQELAGHLNSEINTLGYPKAAIFGFCVALVIFNALSLMRAAMRGCHGAQIVEENVSNYYIAAELETTARGMMIAIPHAHWQIFAVMTPVLFGQAMLMLAGKMNLRHFQKHPRGPKKPSPKKTYDPEHPHVSTAKLLNQRPPRKRRTM